MLACSLAPLARSARLACPLSSRPRPRSRHARCPSGSARERGTRRRSLLGSSCACCRLEIRPTRAARLALVVRRLEVVLVSTAEQESEGEQGRTQCGRGPSPIRVSALAGAAHAPSSRCRLESPSSRLVLSLYRSRALQSQCRHMTSEKGAPLQGALAGHEPFYVPSSTSRQGAAGSRHRSSSPGIFGRIGLAQPSLHMCVGPLCARPKPAEPS